MATEKGGRPEWTVLSVLEDVDFALEVKKLPFSAPAYSLAALAKKKDKSGFTNFIPVKIARENGRVSIANDPAGRFESLIRTAEQIILDDAQRAEDEFQRTRKVEHPDRQKRDRPKGTYKDPGHP